MGLKSFKKMRNGSYLAFILLESKLKKLERNILPVIQLEITYMGFNSFKHLL